MVVSGARVMDGEGAVENGAVVIIDGVSRDVKRLLFAGLSTTTTTITIIGVSSDQIFGEFTISGKLGIKELTEC
jgi:hypothetical protein